MDAETEFKARLDPSSCPKCWGRGKYPQSGKVKEVFYCDCPQGPLRKERDDEADRLVDEFGSNFGPRVHDE